MNIDKMSNWDILTYLREERNWMVQSHYSKEDLEKDFDITFEDDEDWNLFTSFACDCFDDVKEEIMSAIVEEYKVEEYKK